MPQSAENILLVETKNNYVFDDEIKDESGPQDLDFAENNTSQLTDLNLKLQGKSKLIAQLYDDIKCIIPKLSLWKSQSLNKTSVHFPKCKELKNAADTDSILYFAEIILSFAKYNSHLELLSTEFQERFRDFSSFEHQFTLFSAPFTFDIAKVEKSLQMKLLETQSNSSLTAKYFEAGIRGVFACLPENLKNLREFSTRFTGMFGSTYVCKQLFSFMKSTKTSQRTRQTDQQLSSLIKLRAAQTFQPDIPKIVCKTRCQASGQNTKTV
ncbi:Hypothetical predicted protein [Octopus vulgaris]|uniref:General transcription factor II-I repeat domain-containing protein 2B-like n=1 Tax=Octopus vulgaris TaxID=6645 RepID=A0AA36AXY4_OCTVU|nr:Hypothetical predicted protein [Octopus vulgaris]